MRKNERGININFKSVIVTGHTKNERKTHIEEKWKKNKGTIAE